MRNKPSGLKISFTLNGRRYRSATRKRGELCSKPCEGCAFDIWPNPVLCPDLPCGSQHAGDGKRIIWIEVKPRR